MPSSRLFLDLIMDQLSGLNGITSRKMMGEYILYCNGKIIGGIYDNRFLLKPSKTAVSMMPEAVFEKPYEGARDMLLVEDIDDREFLESLVTAVYNEI